MLNINPQPDLALFGNGNKEGSSRARNAGIGFDIVQVSRITESLQAFGAAFTRRLFTPSEVAYASSGQAMQAERLAARFAAKEAVIKALVLTEVGVNWRDIEVTRDANGACAVKLHGAVAVHAQSQGVQALHLSLSHDGDYAGAVVLALFHEPP